MSERKQVIHVRDLVIKADNVYIEPSRSHHRNPFLGGRKPEEEADVEDRHEDKKDLNDEYDDKDERRDPFAWF
ncbi:hypothetical protein [Oceanobacillus manasiensis]|uniref:hypothetical protein n=1 Tax=Oceanobacillus manasiensis TaxID=586413 RepID=UPI0005A72072|nr:hypothetical protein [Oceanobacillus manasiensis]